MGWFTGKSQTLPQEVSVSIDKINVDEAVARIEAATKKFIDAEKSLRGTITDAKRVKTEVENANAAARRRGKGGW